MFKNNSERIKIILFIILSIYVIFSIWERGKEVQRIKKNHIVCCGTISSINSSKGGPVIEYEFFLEGKLLKANGGCTYYTKNRFETGISHNILVVIEKGHPSDNRLVESTLDFDKYDIIANDTVGLNCSYMDY